MLTTGLFKVTKQSGAALRRNSGVIEGCIDGQSGYSYMQESMSLNNKCLSSMKTNEVNMMSIERLIN